MTTYTATFKDGTTYTRNSKRNFTHAIRLTDVIYTDFHRVYWASSLKLAEGTGKAQAVGGYQTYEVAEAFLA